MKTKKILALILSLAMLLSVGSLSAWAEDTVVATVGSTEYTSITDAVAAWTTTAGSTLTLKADVTLSDVIKLKSTEVHTLNLGTYTMTAASGKHAIQILNYGRTNASYALYINADATTPGGITATGKSCIYYSRYSGNMASKDRPIIVIKGGVFNGSTAISQSGSNGTNCPQFQISGGVFNAPISTNRSMVNISGGTFNVANRMSVDSSAYCLISGGRFVSVANSAGSNLYEGIEKAIANGTPIDSGHKWTIGEGKGIYSKDVYVDEEGYFVVGGSIPAANQGKINAEGAYVYSETKVARTGFEAYAPKENLSKTSDSFYYSNVNNDQKLYYKSAKIAIEKESEVVLLAQCDEDAAVKNNLTLDTTQAAYLGKLSLPATKTLTVLVNDGDDFAGEVLPATGYRIVASESEAVDGIVTITYVNEEIVDETNAGANVVDGDEVTYYKTFAKAMNAVDGTVGKTLVMMKDELSGGIYFNAGETDVTIDLAGYQLAVNSTGHSYGTNGKMTFIDSSEAKTGAVANDIFHNLDIAEHYTVSIQGGTWPIDPENYTKDGVDYDFVPGGFTAVELDTDEYLVIELDEVVETEMAPTEGVAYKKDINGNLVKTVLTVDADNASTYTKEDGTEAQRVFVHVEYVKNADFSEIVATFGEAMVFDISFMDEEGKEVEFEGEATVKIPYEGADVDDCKVFFVNEAGELTDMKATYDAEEKVFVFTATHFSQYAVVNVNAAYAENVYIQFKATDDANVYEIHAVAEDGKVINRLMSAQMKFNLINSPANKTKVSYELVAAENVAITTNYIDGYTLFNFTGTPADSGVRNNVLLGKVKFGGYGQFRFETIGSADKAKLHTATVMENIVVDYVPYGATFELFLSGTDNNDNAFGTDAFGGIIEGEFEVPTETLTVNISFPNSVEDNDATYQDMTITISGADLETPIVRELGGNANADGSYTELFEKCLTLNTPYNVAVTGAGYRTARYTVTMNEAKTLNFWNDLKVVAEEVEVGNEHYTTKTTFLAGDIVADEDINIYDLSAVVSYFGETGLKALSSDEYAKYVKYDLNRDGKIDSKDVAYVLASWEA